MDRTSLRCTKLYNTSSTATDVVKFCYLLHHHSVYIRSSQMGIEGKEALRQLLNLDEILLPQHNEEILFLGLTITICSLCVTITLIGLICTIQKKSNQTKVNPETEFDSQSTN